MDFNTIKKVFTDALKFDRMFYEQADVLTFACDNDRYINFEGKKYSPLINTLEDSLSDAGLSCISITRIASKIKGEASHGNVLSPEGAFARALITKRIKSLFVRKDYPYSFFEERIWDDILTQTGARAVIGINPSRELCTVCHRKDIWVADMQHGVISDTHPWYGAAFRGNDVRERLPDAFLCWDEGSSQVIKKWALKRDIDVIKIGNPWVERFLKKDPDDRIYTELKKKYVNQRANMKTILVSISWGQHRIPNGFIHPELEKLIVKNVDKYNWVIRLHPNQLIGFASDEGPRFLKYFNETFPQGKVEWDKTTHMPLPLLLSTIDLHITWNSSVCIEAAYFGIRSLLLDDELQAEGENKDYYTHLEQLGYVDKALAREELIDQWLLNNIDKKIAPYQSYADNYQKLVFDIKARADE